MPARGGSLAALAGYTRLTHADEDPPGAARGRVRRVAGRHPGVAVAGHPRRAGGRRHGGAVATCRRPRGGRHDCRRRRRDGARGRGRGGRDRPGPGARVHRRAQPLDRGAREGTRGDHASVAGHHHCGRGPGRQFAVADRRLPGPPPGQSAGGERRRPGRARHHPDPGHGRRLQATGPAGRGRAHADAGRFGDGRGRARPVLGPRIRGGHLLRHRGGDRNGAGSRRPRRPLHLAHPRRSRLVARGHPRGDCRWRAREAAGADHAHQAGHGRGVGQGARGRGHRRSGPAARRRRHRRCLSLPGLAIHAQGARPQQALRRSGQRRPRARRHRRRQERADHTLVRLPAVRRASGSTRWPSPRV